LSHQDVFIFATRPDTLRRANFQRRSATADMRLGDFPRDKRPVRNRFLFGFSAVPLGRDTRLVHPGNKLPGYFQLFLWNKRSCRWVFKN
jgi:hypothetical protein